MDESQRATAREIAHRHLTNGDFLGWFEDLYACADGDASVVPWADLAVNPNLVCWLDGHCVSGDGKRALKVGCGLGDDAEELTKRGFDTTPFDISETAIAWCRQRFPNSRVKYLVMDLFQSPEDWQDCFDFVLESYTLQVLPAELRMKAIAAISKFVTVGGSLLVISRGREAAETEGKMPWPLRRSELLEFQKCGLTEVSFEDYIDQEEPPVRRFRAFYTRQ
ncbi:MAG TPA: methyltransferase domain-containing protein [Sedimentisphaerales bacterium]|nr:methyltransferase domain-containing protein [Sedimentisphaerales bacterium]